MKTEFSNFNEWNTAAFQLGWIHSHDNYVVLDEAESGECIGEFDSITHKGWIYSEFLLEEEV